MNACRYVLAGAAWLFGIAAFAGPEEATRSDPVIEVRQQIPSEIDPGSAVGVELVIRNAGSSAAEDVTVCSALPAGFELVAAEPRPQPGAKPTWVLARLAPGEEQTLRLQLRRKADATEARLTSVVDVSYRGRVRSVAEAVVRQPVLTLSAAGPASVTLNDPALFRITVSNTGTGPARDVVLMSLLPKGLEHKQGNDLAVDLGTIAAGKSRTVELAVAAKRTGDMRVQIRLESRDTAVVEEVTCCRVEPAWLTLTASTAGPVEVNRPALHELVVTNDGPNPAPKVELVLTLPKEVDFARATDRGEFDPTTRNLRWEFGDLPPGAKRVVVWNGLIRSTGEWPARARLRVEGKDLREFPCTLRAVSTGVASEVREGR